MFRAALCRLAPTLGRGPAGCLACYSSASKSGVGVIGATFEKGQPRVGVSEGPRVIRETGVFSQLSSLGVDVLDYGDVREEKSSPSDDVGPDGERHHTSVLEYNRRLSAAVSRVVGDGRVCVTLGGDHSTAIGTINGHAAARPDHQVVVLWVDAHADINTGGTSPSGNMHGMPVAHHLHQLTSRINKLSDGWPKPCLDAHHIVFIGLRDVDPAEGDELERQGILYFGMREVDRLGLSNVLATSLTHLRPSPTRPLHLSFDIDVLDPLEAPSTGTAVRGGLTLREGLAVCEAVRAAGHLSALDMVEVNPSLGTSQDAALTAHAARLMLLSALTGYRGS